MAAARTPTPDFSAHLIPSALSIYSRTISSFLPVQLPFIPPGESSPASMASVSATFIKLGSSLKLPRGSSQASGKHSSLKMVSVSRFPSLQSSCFRICCSAKPETLDKVCEIVRNQLALPPESPLTPESKFSAFGADSLDTVEIVMALEEAFSINVEEESAQNITTVQEAADMIEKLVEKKAEAA